MSTSSYSYFVAATRSRAPPTSPHPPIPTLHSTSTSNFFLLTSTSDIVHIQYLLSFLSNSHSQLLTSENEPCNKSRTMAPKGPYKLCTVNTAPERAKRLVGRVVEDVKEDYTILHVENAESMCSSFLYTWDSRNKLNHGLVFVTFVYGMGDSMTS